jgi:site-specific recombinase XerD
MELFFTDAHFVVGEQSKPRVPFVVDENMELVVPVNQWLFDVAVVNGKTSQKPLTWQAYGYRIVDFLSWLAPRKLRWDRVQKKHVALYRDWSLQSCASSTVNAHLSAVALFYAFAEKQGLVQRSPIDRVDLKRRDLRSKYGEEHRGRRKKHDVTKPLTKPLPPIFDKDELRLMLRAADSWESQIHIATWEMTGIRRSELAWMELKSVEKMVKKLMSSDATVLPLWLTRTKNGDPRNAYLTRGLAKEYHHWNMLVRPARAELYKKKHGEAPPMFWLSKRGNPLNLEMLSNKIRKLGESVGIKANPHKFRHTFGTDTFAATGDLRKVQKLLGQRSILSTMVYEHSGDIDEKGSLERYQKEIDELLIAELNRG